MCKYIKKKKVSKYMLKVVPEKKGIFADKPLILRRKTTERFEDLAALHKTEFIWCTNREQMIHVLICHKTCKRRPTCQRYQNYIEGCDKNGNPLL